MSLKSDISLFVKHIRSKMYRLVYSEYLSKELGIGNIDLSIRLCGILSAHEFDMGNTGLIDFSRRKRRGIINILTDRNVRPTSR